MRIFMLLIVTAFLAGCATTAERAADMQRQTNEMIAVYGPACQKLGFKPDSDRWRDCILRLDARDNQAGYPTMTNCVGNGGFMQCTSF
jgi:hypothetical protein